MEGDIALMTRAVRNASQFLLRDYYELEHLQNSTKSTINFCNKSCQKVLSKLQENLSKYFKHIIFDKDEVKGITITDKTILVEIMDGFENFSRAIPNFAIMVTLMCKKGGKIYADKSVINFPATGEMIRVEKGQGVILERYDSNVGNLKLKMSQTSQLSDVIISVDKDCLSEVRSFDNFRFYNAPLFSIYQLVAGKIDLVITKVNHITFEGIKLFIEEAGGKILVRQDKLIASNLPLSQKTELIAL
ncbi:MAG: hypothetical protein H6909_04905 [Rickettsiaceae bacterium]|nr:hypothetical protein [Rickettsiaceae bacterium]